MLLTLSGTDRCHDIQNVCLLFFPLSSFTDEDGKSLSVTFCEDKATAVFIWNGQRFESVRHYEAGRFDAERLCVKRAVYDVLKLATSIDSPWGLLTGIKSAIYLDKLRGVYGQKAEQIMQQDYLVLPEKIELCKKVLKQRQPAVKLCGRDRVSLYISIPFCPSRCKYCSFVSSATSGEGNMIDAYLQRLHHELVQKAHFIRQNGYKVLTVYIGGGTPTVLSVQQLKDLLTDVEKLFDLSCVVEYTVEAGRPDTITAGKLDVLRQFGVGRISVNPQTLNDAVLKIIGRNHTVSDFFRAYELACQKQFDINIDVIAGLPADTFDSFASSFEKVLALCPANVTLHTLYVKRGADYGIGHFVPPLEQAELTGRMVCFAEQACDRRQYLPYYLYRQKNTVGNHENVGYALDGKQCLYNIFMMDDIQTVIGAGANAATKFVGLDGQIKRYTNTKYSYNYMKQPFRTDGII